MSEDEELLDALRAAGVDLDQIEVPEPDYHVTGTLYPRVQPFRALRPDLGEVLFFDRSGDDEPKGWGWVECDDEGGCVSDGWAPDLPSMVAKVVEFLSKEES